MEGIHHIYARGFVLCNQEDWGLDNPCRHDVCVESLQLKNQMDLKQVVQSQGHHGPNPYAPHNPHDLLLLFTSDLKQKMEASVLSHIFASFVDLICQIAILSNNVLF